MIDRIAAANYGIAFAKRLPSGSNARLERSPIHLNAGTVTYTILACDQELSSGGIEEVVEPPGRLEFRAVSARGAHRPVAEVERNADLFGLTRIGKTGAPRPSVGAAALRADFAAAQIGKSAIAAMRAENVGNAVGDVTLRDSVEGDTHPGAQ